MAGFSGSDREVKGRETALACSAAVRAGASVLIVDRGRPVARLEPVAALGDSSDAIDQLAAAFIAANRQPATLDLVTLDDRSQRPLAKRDSTS